MITLDVNPQGMDDDYLKCLNFCFGNWGDRRKYDWYFRRKTSYPEADLMVLTKDNKLAAGSAVTYGRVAFPNGSEVTVGIMTGAWTLPGFRNQGHFAHIIEESLRLTALKGAALLLGFAVDDRSSFRQLVRAGSALFPCSYIFSTAQTECPETKSRLRPLPKSERVMTELSSRLDASGRGCSRFIYASEEEFAAQFIHRPGETGIFDDSEGNCGVIEKTRDTDLLQLYLTGSDDEASITESIASFLVNALGRGQKLFLYSTRPDIASASRKLGLEVKQGYLTVLVADASRLSDALGIPAPTSLKDSSLLTRADSDWYLGAWSLHGGNRA